MAATANNGSGLPFTTTSGAHRKAWAARKFHRERARFGDRKSLRREARHYLSRGADSKNGGFGVRIPHRELAAVRLAERLLDLRTRKGTSGCPYHGILL